MASWKNTTMSLEFGHEKLNHDAEDTKDHYIKHREVALKHDETGAVVKLTDDGFIDIFAGPQLGLRVDPVTNTVNLFGDSVNIIANQLNLKTKPHGFTWNGQSFNPEANIFTPSKRKARYSAGMIDILKDFGLPVDKEDSNG